MTDQEGGQRLDEAGWEGTRRAHLRSTLAATPAQRLEWLEAALELARASGALARHDRRSRGAGSAGNTAPDHTGGDVE